MRERGRATEKERERQRETERERERQRERQRTREILFDDEIEHHCILFWTVNCIFTSTTLARRAH